MFLHFQFPLPFFKLWFTSLWVGCRQTNDVFKDSKTWKRLALREPLEENCSAKMWKRICHSAPPPSNWSPKNIHQHWASPNLVNLTILSWMLFLVYWNNRHCTRAVLPLYLLHLLIHTSLWITDPEVELLVFFQWAPTCAFILLVSSSPWITSFRDKGFGPLRHEKKKK